MDGKPFHVHLDGYDQSSYITGAAKESPRNAIMYMSDDGEAVAVRVGDYKFNLAVQRAHTMRLWAEPFVKLRLPYIVNLRRDPFELAEINSNTYLDWMVDHVPQLYMCRRWWQASLQTCEVPASKAGTTRGVQPGCGDGTAVGNSGGGNR